MKIRSLVRVSALVAVAAALFVACGGRVEGEYADAGSDFGGPNCGNGKLDDGEECDGTHLGGETCSTQTMGMRPRGTLACTRSCKIDRSPCTGNGTNGTGGTSSGTGGRTNGTGGRIGGTGGAVGTGGRVGGGNTGGTTSSCTSTRDCTGRQVCCGTQMQGAYSFECAATCGNGSVAAACHQASDCGRGEVCCATTNRNGTTLSSIACAATCSGNAERVLCGSSRECTQGQSCQASRSLPSGFQTCR